MKFEMGKDFENTYLMNGSLFMADYGGDKELFFFGKCIYKGK